MKKQLKILSFIPFMLFSFAVAGCKTKSFQEKIFDVIVSSGYEGTYEEWLNYIDGKEKGHILTGTYNPVSSIGEDGDIFVNTSTLDVYVKVEGRWILKGNLNGSQVEHVDDFNDIYAGTEDPNDTLGNNGDLYINCTTGNVFQKIDNTWRIIGSIPDGCGTTGSTAYEKYKSVHPEYTYSEGRWMNDMFSGSILEAERHTVEFDSNGGTLVDNQYVVHGKFITEPKSKLTGWLVDGWFTETGEKWLFESNPCIEDTSLVANWIKDENTLMISEVVSKNRYSYTDYYGEHPDYIELWNGTSVDIPLLKYTITNNKVKYTFPNITIKSHSYLMIIADGRNEVTPNGEVHVPFTLSQPKGGKLTINSNLNAFVDSIAFPDMKDDVAFGCLNGNYSLLYPTASAKNEKVYVNNVTLDAPSFSKESGKYDEPFLLDIESKKNYEIHYTLDCSEPTIESPIFEESLLIEDPSSKPNKISNRTDICASRIPYSPTDPVSKCAVIKAICVDNEGHISPVASSSYWINQGDFLIENTPIISISTDEDNLFGSEKGIYCNGKIYDDYRNSDSYSSSTNYWSMPANYRQKGYEWERQSDLTYIDKNGKLVCEQQAGIRIHGNSSRSFEKKAFNVFSRYNYDKNNKFSYKFNGRKCDTFTLRACGNEGHFMLTDSMNSMVAERIGLKNTIQQNSGTYFYLNGEFWGYYLITDKFNDTYIEEEYGVDNIVMFKNGLLEEGHTTHKNEIYTYLNYATKDFSDETIFSEFASMVDFEQLIDFTLFQLYIGNNDWNYWNNVCIWKSEDIGSTTYEDGKYRFLLFDTDYGGGTTKAPDYNSYESANMNISFQFMFNIAKNEEWKNYIINRANEMVEKLKNKQIIDDLTEYFNSNLQQVNQSFVRFTGADKNASNINKFNNFIKFVNERSPYFIDLLNDKL